MSTWYCTRESVKAAVDVKDSARANAQIDRLIEDASRSADKLCHRTFYPWLGTKYFNWPDSQSPTSYRLWLGEHEVVSVSEVTAAGTVIPAVYTGSIAGYFLEPQADGPPYDRLEINRAATGSFNSGSTPQRNVGVTGLFMGCLYEETPAGALAEALDDNETQVDVTDGSLVGVGTVLRVGTERITVTERRSLSLGVTVAAPGLTDKVNSKILTLSATTAAVQPGEILLVESERMEVMDVAGAVCTVERATDGSTLAAHAAGVAVYSYRTLVVARGALGTVSAAHDTASPAYAWVPPGSVATYSVAEVLNGLAQENSGYVRVIGSSEGARNASGAGLADVRDKLYRNYGRKARTGAI